MGDTEGDIYHFNFKNLGFERVSKAHANKPHTLKLQQIVNYTKGSDD